LVFGRSGHGCCIISGKINIDSDGRLVMTAILRKIFAEKPGGFDPRKYLGPARDEPIKMVRYKNEQVLMNAGKA
jgi:fructose-bisphosphate aldolase, class II